MPEDENISEAAAGAAELFDKGEQMAKAGDFDGAIDAYIEALRIEPDAVKQGHIKLRELALTRQARGGEKASAEEAEQRLKGDVPLEKMLGAEYLLARDPGHLSYAVKILKAAVAGRYNGTVKWIADLLFLANNGAKKPALNVYLLLKEAYMAIGHLERAISACNCAAKLRPDDKALAGMLKELTAKRSAAEDLDEEFDRLDEGHDADERLDDLGGDELAEAGDSQASPNAQVPKGAGPSSISDQYGDPQLDKAIVCFAKARQIAQVGDFDYAIDLYLEGLRCTPDAVQDGHLPLCDLALQRQKKGGKKPTMVEKVKHLRGKTALEKMINAEYLFAKDPGNISYQEAMLKAAIAGDFIKTATWIANYLFQANNAAKKPSFQTYILLKNSYAELGQYDKAVVACQRATKIRPNDGSLADELKRLTAEHAVTRGHYDQQEGDFRDSLLDREKQEKLQAQESVVKTVDYRVQAIADARKALARDPDLPKNIFDLAQALSDLGNDKADSEAIMLLENAYKSKRDFSYHQRAGQIRIDNIKRKIREAKAMLKAKPDHAKIQARLAVLSSRFNTIELEHYHECTENYPTDLQMKYEYGLRLIRNKQYDDAIPLFQEAQRDLRHKIAAMDKIGLCFFMKGWYADAIDVFTSALKGCENKEDKMAKELRYNLARAYEEQGDNDKALEVYRKIAQLDFGFKDVRQRVDKLRSQ